MTHNEHLLMILSEECAETMQRASKVLRFTAEEIQPLPGNTQTNSERLVYEFNDIVAVMELLQEAGVVHNVIDRIAIDKKKEKVKDFILYSQTVGTLTVD